MNRVAAPAAAMTAFPLTAVRLLPGPFLTAQRLNAAYLLSLDPDRLLAGFRSNAGLAETAKPYGGWESRGLVGHSLGHYLSACAMTFAATGDSAFADRVAYITAALAECQATHPDGFLGGMPNGRALYDAIAAGGISAEGFDLNGAWVPWYNQHKLFAGLRDAWIYTQDDTARRVLIRLGEWCVGLANKLDDAQMQTMLRTEHGGMNETLADLYAITGDDAFLHVAERFWHQAVLDPLTKGHDELTGQHANTQIPKVIGAARLYELTGNARYRRTVDTFWDAVVHRRSFVTGSNSDREHFFPVGLEAGRLGPENGETCNVYNMLKLTAHRARWTGDATPFDYYELGLVNHILGSIDPQSGMTTYFQSLEPGRFKVYGTPTESFWCCTGTGMENHAKYAADVYTHGPDTLSVNLFVASELVWPERSLSLRQVTAFPESGTTALTLKLAAPTPLKLRIRVPGWATEGIEVSGVVTAHGEAGSGWLTIDRTWHDGDTIAVRLPMALRLHRAVDDATQVALVHGPLVLAATLGREDFPESDLVADHTCFNRRPLPDVPVLVTDSPGLDWLTPVAGQAHTLTTVNAGRPHELTFAPFYRVHHERYAVYVRLLTTGQFAEREAQLAADRHAARALAARTVDAVQFGEQQPEKDHDIRFERSGVGFQANVPCRYASDGGFFSVVVRVLPGEPLTLRCRYWGSDTGRVFDLLADDRLLATQRPTGAQPERLFDVDYPLPPGTADRVKVTFRPHPASTAGGVFGLTVLRNADPAR